MTESIIERAARAAAEADQEDYEEAPLLYREIVRAVLRAIREPSEAMLKVMRDELPLVDDPDHLGAAGYVEYWHAILDAALADDQPRPG